MAPNTALKRAAKANRRKAVVAVKRKLEVDNGSLAAQVARAGQAPIQHCLLSADCSRAAWPRCFWRGERMRTIDKALALEKPR